VVQDQLISFGCAIRELRAEIIGVNSVVQEDKVAEGPPEVRVRIAGRTESAEDAHLIAGAIEALYTNGPAGGGGVTRSVRPVLAIASTSIPREFVRTEIDWRVAK
jgi:hypothetical protein